MQTGRQLIVTALIITAYIVRYPIAQGIEQVLYGHSTPHS